MKMFPHRLLIYSVFIGLIIVSCKNDGAQQSLMPHVTGAAGEVVVVISKGKWESAVGSEVQKVLSTPQTALPRPEPKFDIIHIPYDAFGKIFKTQRNLLFIRVSPDFTKNRLTIQENTWAKSQVIITAEAKNDSSMVALLAENTDKIVHVFEDIERSRLMNTYFESHDREVVAAIKSNFNIELIVPKGFTIHRTEPDFMYLLSEYRDIIEGLIIYTYDYTDTNTFTTNYLVNMRNEFAKKYIPGELPGSYMTTEDKYPTEFTAFKLKNTLYTAEIRGLWKMANGMAMGGPFISVSQVQQSTGKIIAVEGFVFAPAHDKRNLMRRMESIAYSLQADIPTPEQTKP